ncbi:MAG: hypothetical protein IPJ18_16080 [Betaproteobacteria bacterium]|nr:hypothetical protein [Betaproteobacteria bacterium]
MSNKTGFISLGLLAVLCSQAFAQSSDGSGIGLTGERKPGSINANGVFITPTVDLLVGNNNNVASAPAGVAKISSTVVSLRPGIVADIERRGDKYQASYFGQFDRYASSSADNIDNHDLRVTGQNYLSPRPDVNWGLRYVDRFDPRSANAFVAVPAPIHHRTTELKARGGYGAEGAPGRLELYTGAASKKAYQWQAPV